MTTSTSVNSEIHTINCESVLTQSQAKKLRADKGTLLTIAFFAIAISIAVTCYALGLIPAEFR